MNFTTNGQQVDSCYPRKMNPRSWYVTYHVVPSDRQMITKNQVQMKYLARRYHKSLVLPFIFFSIWYEIWDIVNNNYRPILKCTSNGNCDVINVWTSLISNGNTLWFYRNVYVISFQPISAKMDDEGRVNSLNLILLVLVPEQGRRLSQLRIVLQETSSFAKT